MARGGFLSSTRTRLILLLVTALALITLDFRGSGPVDGARDLVGTALSPVRSALDAVLDPIGDAWDGAWNRDELERQLAEAEAQLAEIDRDELQNAELLREIDELRDMLDLRERVEYPTVVARVERSSPTNFQRTLSIDKGSSDGISIDMPVEAPGGLVGRIHDVGDDWATVQLLTDTEFSVGLRLSRDGETGEGQGQGRAEPLKMEFIDGDTPVVPGETVTTSGLPLSNYPPGIVVGTVQDVDDDPITRSRTVLVAPSADLDALDYVTVVMFRPPAVQSAEDPA